MKREFVALSHGQSVEVLTDGLTEKEVLVLMGLRNSTYGDPLFDPFTFRDGIKLDGMTDKAIVAVLASLSKKGEVGVEYHDKSRSCVSVTLHDCAKSRFSDFNIIN